MAVAVTVGSSAAMAQSAPTQAAGAEKPIFYVDLTGTLLAPNEILFGLGQYFLSWKDGSPSFAILKPEYVEPIDRTTRAELVRAGAEFCKQLSQGVKFSQGKATNTVLGYRVVVDGDTRALEESTVFRVSPSLNPCNVFFAHKDRLDRGISIEPKENAPPPEPTTAEPATPVPAPSVPASASPSLPLPTEASPAVTPQIAAPVTRAAPVHADYRLDVTNKGGMLVVQSADTVVTFAPAKPGKLELVANVMSADEADIPDFSVAVKGMCAGTQGTGTQQAGLVVNMDQSIRPAAVRSMCAAMAQVLKLNR